MNSNTGKRSSLLIKLAVLAAICGIGLTGAASASSLARGQDTPAQPAGVTIAKLLQQDAEAALETGLTSPAAETVTRMVVTTTFETVTVPVTLEKIVIEVSGYTSIFDRDAPEIPHAYNLYLEHTGDGLYDDDGMPECFTCHVVPQEHAFWAKEAETCERCHKITPAPKITPPYVMPVYR